MTYTVRPISDRAFITGRSTGWPFRSVWTDTEQLLLTEVAHLKGHDLVLEVDVTEGELRLDGRIRANARPATPAVRVAFDSKHGPLTYATDRYAHWQQNTRAIALALEALRKVDRYGVTKRGEQYAGWKQLPAGRAMPPSHMTTEQADALFTRVLGGRWSNRLTPTPLRDARIATHPDRHGGDRTAYDQLEQAALVLGVTR